MELKLESNLPHQTIPVEGVAEIVEASMSNVEQKDHQNPLLSYPLNKSAISSVRQITGIEERAKRLRIDENRLPKKVRDLPIHSLLDVKMETGTGKTYVYTRTMLELHKRCHFNKFIIAVPTLPIKVGTASFISEPEARRHFSQVCGYNTEIDLCLLEAQKQQKKNGRLNMPTAVRKFFAGNKREENKIYVLLLNTQLLTNGKMLTRDDYDNPVGGFNRPVDAISDTKPVLIIDEPHRMKRDTASYISLINNFKPQLVLRYGATFPEWPAGKGKKPKKDYQELVYDLNAAESFNQGLIKGVAKEHLELPGGKNADKKVKIVFAEKGNCVHLKYTDEKTTDTYRLGVGDSLGTIDRDLDGITVEGITGSSILLSNGQEKLTGEEFYPDQFAESYQEAMINLALQRHFETERRNFERDGLPIKTLALFFIDNIDSFRGVNGNNDGWLRKKFIELLTFRVNAELQKENSERYEAYLKATLADIEHSCAGYFARDKKGNVDKADKDDNIANEVELILHGKKQLLSFEKEDGSPNVLRFLFSKWTLKEGWDNPNVFTICKLRSSGSETSKLQEVGRGLRLPVDSAGNRISDDSFMLNYIVDFTERDFAKKLIKEINGELEEEMPEVHTITDRNLEAVANKHEMTADDLFDDLYRKNYIDRHYHVVDDNRDAFLQDYPEFVSVIGGGTVRIRDNNKGNKNTVPIRKTPFEGLRELWNQLNRKYVLYVDKDIENKLIDALPSIISDRSVEIFSYETLKTTRQKLQILEGRAALEGISHTEVTVPNMRMKYNEFLKRASALTNIPINELHKAICIVAKNGKKITNEMFNRSSLARLVIAVNDWKCKNMVGHVNYKQANYVAHETKLTNADGSVKDDVVQTFIGRKLSAGVPPEQYLYDKYAYDSDLELEDMKNATEEIVVYGKIPARSICIPTIASSNYSPDFMYVVKKVGGKQELNIVIETKDYDSATMTSEDEDAKIKCAEEFFKEMTAKGFTVHYKKQIRGNTVKEIINDLLQNQE